MLPLRAHSEYSLPLGGVARNGCSRCQHRANHSQLLRIKRMGAKIDSSRERSKLRASISVVEQVRRSTKATTLHNPMSRSLQLAEWLYLLEAYTTTSK